MTYRRAGVRHHGGWTSNLGKTLRVRYPLNVLAGVRRHEAQYVNVSRETIIFDRE